MAVAPGRPGEVGRHVALLCTSGGATSRPGPQKKRSFLTIVVPMPTRCLVTHASRARPTASIRLAVPAALAVGALYLAWRWGWTRTGSDPVLFWVLWAAELTIWLSLARSAWETWTLRTDPRRHSDHARSVDLVVVCRDESLEVLRATLLGCGAVRGEHRTVALDTIGRADLEGLGAMVGVDVLRIDGADPTEAAEAHVNPVLDRLDGELLALLRADDVPLPEMLEELAGDFDDKEVWLAQGRQALHGPSAGEQPGVAADLELFFRVVQPGKNHHGAALWCGSGGVLRRTALDALGGVPATTDTPTFQLSVAAAEAGWRSTYHDRAVVLTLTRPDVEGFVLQRSRWAYGNLRVLRTRHSPLFARHLRPSQRISFLGTLLTYLGGPRRLAFAAVLCATLVAGALPLRADPLLLVSSWLFWMGCNVLARRLLGRGMGGSLGAARNQWLLIGVHCTAWLSLLVPRSVTRALRTVPSPETSASPAAPAPPGRRRRRADLQLRLLLAVATAVLASAVGRLLAVLGLLDLPTLPTAAEVIALGAAATLVASITLLAVEVARRHRRRRPRFGVEVAVVIDGVRSELVELSERGASVRFDTAPRVGCPYVMALHVPGLDGEVHTATVAAEVRSVRRADPPGHGHVAGVAFTHLSATARDRLAEYCRVLLPARDAADGDAGHLSAGPGPHGSRPRLGHTQAG